MKKCLGLALSAALLALPGLAMAGSDSGFYVGGSVGQASVGDIEDPTGGGDISFDGDDTGYKLFVGYNFGVIPLLDLGIEGGYIDLGNPDDGGLEVKADGYTLAGLVGGRIGPVGLFAKLGMINWDADLSDGIDSAGDDGTDPLYGIGARLNFGSLEVRAEYEYFDIDTASDVDFLSLGAAWNF